MTHNPKLFSTSQVYGKTLQQFEKYLQSKFLEKNSNLKLSTDKQQTNELFFDRKSKDNILAKNFAEIISAKLPGFFHANLRSREKWKRSHHYSSKGGPFPR